MPAAESATPEVDVRDRRAVTEFMAFVEDAPDFYVLYNADREYIVDVRGESCTCSDFEYRAPEGGCKHVRRILIQTGMREMPDVPLGECDPLLVEALEVGR